VKNVKSKSCTGEGKRPGVQYALFARHYGLAIIGGGMLSVHLKISIKYLQL
jgi:hypothetical protein